MKKETIEIDEDAIREVFGANLRIARSRRGFSQTDLAERAGVQRLAVSTTERGEHNITFKVLVRLCLAAGYHPCELLNPNFLQVSSRGPTYSYKEPGEDSAS
ncbi:helix-turn-helix domain-containing protein [Herbaspirillum sp. B65]|uniref:helix-turn-helix domain-containing protein n=1 Tax=Herbaspirillum sp. B65 TaxID=137708 RepID=UPI000A032FD2